MKGWGSKMTRLGKGFTIVELLIVIVVIGILTAIIIFGYATIQNSAKDASIQSDLTKFSDTIHLKALDDDIVPAGGATSSGTGDATILAGITVQPNADSYDTDVSNLYYCSGKLGGTDSFGFLVRGISGKVFQYLSTVGSSEFTGTFTWTPTVDGIGACTALGFTAPYTWSYGYNPLDEFLWFNWALPDGVDESET